MQGDSTKYVPLAAEEAVVTDSPRQKRFAPSSLVPIFVVLVPLSFYVLYAALRRPIPLYPIPKVDLEGYCSKVPGIPTSEFEARQAALAQTLQTIGGGSYLAEPGASAGYFGNLSSSHWHLSERPLLLHISLEKSKDTEAQAAPHVTVLTPSFEASRAKLLPLAGSSISWVEWPEHEDPFKTLMSALPPHVRSSPVYVDGSIRNFVATGLSRAGADVQPAPASVTALRERKSRAEIDIMKCANEATLHAIRQVRAQMRIGMRESQVRGMVTDALKSAGLSNNWVLALFGDNAALPHGGGADRVLGETEFILIDAGGSLQGYGSDVTRTFALDETRLSREQIKIWILVSNAQASAFDAAHNGTVAESVDAAARKVITDAGFGAYFTHRLGHGIGIETHEGPYLVGGSKAVLAPGNTFSDEPGVYIEGKLGVRLEDCFYIGEDGKPVYLTEGAGGPARIMWKP